MADFTPKERISRFREWVHTASTPSNAKTLKSGSYIMFGATLHALARRSKGAKDMTEIENIGLGLFDLMADSEEESNAYNEIGAEAKKLARSGGFIAANVPNSIMNLSTDTPYTNELFMEDIKKLVVETIQQPHIRAVTPDQIHNDGTIDSTEEYSAATAELQRGVSVFTLNEEETEAFKAEEANVPSSTPMNIKFEPREFYCQRKSGEVGKDEIYFTWGFGSDLKSEVSHRTGEFGSVKSGTREKFPRNPPIWSGNLVKGYCGHIICWEADHSSSEWYTKLIATMREIASKSSLMALRTGDANWDFLIGLIPGPIGMVADVAMWIENIATLVAAFLEFFRNKDDKVSEHSYAWSRAWLTRQVLIGSQQDYGLEFNGGGGGHHYVSGSMYRYS